MFDISQKWTITLKSLVVAFCISGFTEAMQQHPPTEILVDSEGNKIEVPSLFALLDPQQPWGINLLLVEKRERALHESGYFYGGSTREDVTVDIRNLRRLKKTPLYVEWQQKLPELNQTKTYITTQVPKIINNKLTIIQDTNAILENKEAAFRDLERQCQKSLKLIEKIKPMQAFETSMKSTEDKILKSLGDVHRFGGSALTKAQLDQLPPL